jgi:hypothetical protein
MAAGQVVCGGSGWPSVLAALRSKIETMIMKLNSGSGGFRIEMNGLASA